MNINTLLEIIAQGESTTTEFKVQTPTVQKIAKTLCAFANTQGGFFIVGVSDDGNVVGANAIKNEIEKIQIAAQNLIIPALQKIDIKTYMVKNINILSVYVSISSQKPHALITPQNTKIIYIRNGKESIAAGKSMQKIIKKNYVSNNANPSNSRLTSQLCSKQIGLLDYLKQHPRITVKGFMQLMNLSKRRAYRLLTNLVLNGFLVIHENSKENFYTLK